MRIAVVDDQKEFIEMNIKKLRQMNIEDLEISSYSSVYDLEKENIKFDLILLDIDMPDADGIQYAKEHNNLNVVFMTSMGNRVKEAFGTNVYGFIEKDDSQEAFETTMNSVLTSLSQRKSVLFNIKGGGIQKFFINDIIYFQYLHNRNIGFVYREESYTIQNMTMSLLEDMLDNMFIYIDRNTMVNTKKITGVINNKATLQGVNQKFEISRRRYKEVKEIIDRKG